MRIHNAALRMAMEERWARAQELIRAQDTMALLGQLERATGRAHFTDRDRDRFRSAEQRWLVVA